MNKKQEIKELKERIAKLEQECNRPEFKVGDWVRRDEGVFRIGDKYNGSNYKNSRYCVSPNGNDEFFIDLDGAHNHLYTKATHAEIEQALIAEAKRRGFKKGVEIRRGFNIYSKELVHSNNTSYNATGDLLFMGGTCIYEKGEWAEVVEEKPLTIGEYDVDRDGYMVDIGCQSLHLGDIKAFLNIFDMAIDNDVKLSNENIDVLREVVK